MGSKKLKNKAWKSLKGKYWMAFLVSLVCGVLYSFNMSVTTVSQKMMSIVKQISPADMDATMEMGAKLLDGTMLVTGIIGLIFSIFVGNVALVGLCNYFIKNTYSKPTFKDGFSAYKIKYVRNTLTMLLMIIRILLWSLLLVIPGIIKMYQYAMVPYILADNPDMSISKVFKKSKEMMDGNKLRFFMLNISFAGWVILCIPTFGVGALLLAPYIEATNAEFYVLLKKQIEIV